MAKLSPSSLLNGVSGKIGGLVFRQVNGKTVVQAYQESRVKRSELQVLFNDKMRLASSHAKVALRDPAVRAYYEKKKKRLNVSSAYTAACTDFMRHGRIDKIDTSKYNKGQVVVKAYKAELGFEDVVVKLSTRERGEVMQSKAVSKGNGEWVFQGKGPMPKLAEVVITVEAKDKTGNVTRVVWEHEKALVEFHDWQGAPHLK